MMGSTRLPAHCVNPLRGLLKGACGSVPEGTVCWLQQYWSRDSQPYKYVSAGQFAAAFEASEQGQAMQKAADTDYQRPDPFYEDLQPLIRKKYARSCTWPVPSFKQMSSMESWHGKLHGLQALSLNQFPRVVCAPAMNIKKHLCWCHAMVPSFTQRAAWLYTIYSLPLECFTHLALKGSSACS